MSGMVLQALSLGLLAVAFVAAVGALMSRSLFVMCMQLGAAAAAVGSVVLMQGASGAALSVGLVGAVFSPVLLLSAALLSARASKSTKRPWLWLNALPLLVVIAATLWPLAELGAAPPVSAAPMPLGFWLAPLVFAAAIGCVALLGFGERGTLSRGGDS